MNLRTVLLLGCLAAAGCGGSPAPAPVPEAETPAQAACQPLAVESVAVARPCVETAPASPRVTLPEADVRAFPLAATAERVSEPFPHRVICDSAGEVLGYEVFSDSAGTTARGYAGMVPLQVFFDGLGRPVRIYILEHYETQAYMELIYRSGLLEKLLRFDPAEPESLDAVSLATGSSQAIVAGVTGLAARVSTELVAGQGDGPVDTFPSRE